MVESAIDPGRGRVHVGHWLHTQGLCQVCKSHIVCVDWRMGLRTMRLAGCRRVAQFSQIFGHYIEN